MRRPTDLPGLLTALFLGASGLLIAWQLRDGNSDHYVRDAIASALVWALAIAAFVRRDRIEYSRKTLARLRPALRLIPKVRFRDVVQLVKRTRRPLRIAFVWSRKHVAALSIGLGVALIVPAAVLDRSNDVADLLGFILFSAGMVVQLVRNRGFRTLGPSGPAR